ncbi:MAG TPA: hypothetical protein VGD79_05630 [Thermoanaerobaculia bacterium]
MAMLLLVFACDKAAVTSESVTAGSSATAARPSAKDIGVTIKFSGLITYVLGPYQRAVVVYTKTHPHKVTIHATAFKKEAEVMIKSLPGGCCGRASCSFELQYMSLQLLDVAGNALGGDLTFTDASFEDLVTPLNKIDPIAFKTGNLAPVVKGDLEKNSTISWGFVDLRGGDASSTRLDCHGKFKKAGPFSPFSGGTSVHYATLTGGGFLRVAVAGQEAPYVIPLTGPNVTIEVDNDLKSHRSHFHEYDKLTTVTGHKLPKVILENSQACKNASEERGGVPGCHDTRINGGT